MQRLVSSCIRSRSLIYARPLISARFMSSSPSAVLAQELNDKVIDAAELASAPAKYDANLLWSERSKTRMSELLRSPPADAYSGRSVPNPRDLGTAFRLLDGILSRNRVRYQLRLTQRHEKKGAKRRRLCSERWRRQFANEVRKKVQLVVKIRKRGA